MLSTLYYFLVGAWAPEHPWHQHLRHTSFYAEEGNRVEEYTMSGQGCSWGRVWGARPGVRETSSYSWDRVIQGQWCRAASSAQAMTTFHPALPSAIIQCCSGQWLLLQLLAHGINSSPLTSSFTSIKYSSNAQLNAIQVNESNYGRPGFFVNCGTFISH